MESDFGKERDARAERRAWRWEMEAMLAACGDAIVGGPGLGRDGLTLEQEAARKRVGVTPKRQHLIAQRRKQEQMFAACGDITTGGTEKPQREWLVGSGLEENGCVCKGNAESKKAVKDNQTIYNFVDGLTESPIGRLLGIAYKNAGETRPVLCSGWVPKEYGGEPFDVTTVSQIEGDATTWEDEYFYILMGDCYSFSLFILSVEEEYNSNLAYGGFRIIMRLEGRTPPQRMPTFRSNNASWTWEIMCYRRLAFTSLTSSSNRIFVTSPHSGKLDIIVTTTVDEPTDSAWEVGCDVNATFYPVFNANLGSSIFTTIHVVGQEGTDNCEVRSITFAMTTIKRAIKNAASALILFELTNGHMFEGGVTVGMTHGVHILSSCQNLLLCTQSWFEEACKNFNWDSIDDSIDTTTGTHQGR